MTNKNRLFLFVIITGILVVVTASLGCGGSPRAVPNPAAKKCVDDGFELEPVAVNGVPVEYRCVDPATGRSCEVWEYYRNECSLKVPKAANPAAEKCIEDGFELEPVVVNGVPVEYRCVDPATGGSCEVWQYYRNECSLKVPKAANPAAKKCIDDGFELEPVVVNGVPVEYRCVDPATGRSCEVWEYYRKECEPPRGVAPKQKVQ